MFSELQSYNQKTSSPVTEKRIVCTAARNASATDLRPNKVPSVAADVVQLLLQATGISFHPLAGQTPSLTSGNNVRPVACRGLIELEQ